MATKKTNRIAITEYAEHFEQQTSHADRTYADSLRRLKTIRKARKNHQSRQLRRLIQDLGESDVRVLRHAELIAREHEMASYINVAIDRTAVDMTPIEGSFTLRGKVRAEDNTGLSGYKVQLLDRRNQVIGRPVKTDRAGKYVVVIDVNQDTELDDVRLVVIDNKGIQIHQATLPVSVKANAVEARDVRVSSIKSKVRGSNEIIQDAKKALKPSVAKYKTTPKAKKQSTTKTQKPSGKKVTRKTTKKTSKRKPQKKT